MQIQNRKQKAASVPAMNKSISTITKHYGPALNSHKKSNSQAAKQQAIISSFSIHDQNYNASSP